MRIFILSCNTGEGHNSAAKAIAEVLTARGIDSEITDGLAFLSPEVSKFISNWHVRIYKRAPLLFNAGYRMAENHDPAPEDASMVYKALSLGAKKLYAALEAGRYDAVVSTHVFASLVMRRVCQDYPISIPHYLVATDYTCSPYVAEAQADGYFIPDEKLADEFARCGIPKERLIATGIPVRQIFFTPGSRSESRAALGIPADKRVALLMSGSMGCGPIKRLARRLTEMLPEDGMLIVICGHNEKLYESLLELGNRSNLRVLGFTRMSPPIWMQPGPDAHQARWSQLHGGRRQGPSHDLHRCRGRLRGAESGVLHPVRAGRDSGFRKPSGKAGLHQPGRPGKAPVHVPSPAG